MSSEPSGSPGPLVSFIMPVWAPNPEWLRSAVRSVLAEPDIDLELIVVDDGNADRVSGLLADITDSRLRHVPDPSVTDVPHRGASAARNAGLAAAHGSLIRYVDCDDGVVPGSTAHLLRLREGADLANLITFGGMAVCNDELVPLWTMGCIYEGDMWKPVVRGRLDVYVPGLLIPRSVIDLAGPWDTTLRLCEDLDYMFRLAEHAHVRGDDQPVYLYRRHSGSASAATSSTSGGVDPWRSVYDRHYARHPEHRGTRVERWMEAAFVMDRVIGHWRRRQLAPFVRTLLSALRLSPLDVLHHARTAARYHRLQRAAGEPADARSL